MSATELDNDPVGRAAEHMQILVERGETDEALEVARRFRDSFPGVPGRLSLVVFGLGCAGRTQEAVSLPRDVLAREVLDEATRAYLGQVAELDLKAGPT